jgi:hypothetical protein
VPPITELTRIEPVYLDRLDRQGVFTTGILLEVTGTATRRQSLADHVGASTADVLVWRDEALLLNLAAFGSDEHVLLGQAGLRGLRAILEVDLATFLDRVDRAARALKVEPPDELTATGWWEQARTLGTPPVEEVVPASDIAGAFLRFLIGMVVGAGGASVATAAAPSDSAFWSLVAVIAVLAATGFLGRVSAPGIAGFVGLMAGSFVLLAILLGKGVLITLPDTPFWQNQGLAFTLGLGAGPPSAIVGWLAGWVILGRGARGPRARVSRGSAA